MDNSTASLIHLMQDRAQYLMDKGDFSEAFHAANAAVQKAQEELSPNEESIDNFVKSLEQRSIIFLKLNQLEEAKDDIKQALDQFDHRADRLAEIGKLYSLLGVIYSTEKREEKMFEAWTSAVEFFEKNEPPLLLDAAAIYNNMGFSAKAGGNLDLAETYLLKSLEIMHAELGEKHEQTASVSNNLGAVYYASSHYDQSRVMHSMALDARLSVLGEKHPDTAQSHNNLALALLKTNDVASARTHFEKAYNASEALKDTYPEELDAIASNYCDFLRSQGEYNLAEQIIQQVK